MKSNIAQAAHPPIRTGYELLKLLEGLAEEAYRGGEPILAFVLAATAGAYGNGIVRDIGDVLERIVGSEARAGILRRVADEAARSNAQKN
jgi:hypothetical protein